MRDPFHRNYLPHSAYPLDTLPPFAFGNFYILSQDLVEYILRNYQQLYCDVNHTVSKQHHLRQQQQQQELQWKQRGNSSINQQTNSRPKHKCLAPVGDLEDVSIAVWLLPLQVHVTHIPEVISNTVEIPSLFLAVGNIKDMTHYDQLHSYYLESMQPHQSSELSVPPSVDINNDATTVNIQQIEQYSYNRLNRHSDHICVLVMPEAAYAVLLIQKLAHSLFSNHIATGGDSGSNNSGSQSSSVTYQYHRLPKPYLDIPCIHLPSPSPGGFPTVSTEYSMLLVMSPNDCFSDSSGVDEWSEERNRKLTQLFQSFYDQNVTLDHVWMISGEALDFSQLPMRFLSHPAPPTTTTTTTTAPSSTAADEIGGVTLLVSTTTAVTHNPHADAGAVIYIPTLVQCWFELASSVSFAPFIKNYISASYHNYDPLLKEYSLPAYLALPRSRSWVTKRLTRAYDGDQRVVRIAYLYNKCSGGPVSSLWKDEVTAYIASHTSTTNDSSSSTTLSEQGNASTAYSLRTIREIFVNLLRDTLSTTSLLPNTTVTIDALGYCHGYGHTGDDSKHNKRYEKDYLLNAISIYTTYDYVISFENNQIDGYITEKLLLPYLAGAVPVYLGPSDGNIYINNKAIINCSLLYTMRECIEKVIIIVGDDSSYISVLQEPLLRSNETVDKWFRHWNTTMT